MKKIVKKIGGSIGISFSPDEKRLYGIKENDVLEVTIQHIDWSYAKKMKGGKPKNGKT